MGGDCGRPKGIIMLNVVATDLTAFPHTILRALKVSFVRTLLCFLWLLILVSQSKLSVRWEITPVSQWKTSPNEVEEGFEEGSYNHCCKLWESFHWKWSAKSQINIPRFTFVREIVQHLVFTSTCHCLPIAFTTRPSIGLLHAPQMGTPILSWQGKQ